MNMSRELRALAAILFAGFLSGCGSGEAAPGVELTRAQKDSIISGMPLPGASGVGAAMQARDRANARTEAHDTLH